MTIYIPKEVYKRLYNAVILITKSIDRQIFSITLSCTKSEEIEKHICEKHYKHITSSQKIKNFTL